MSSDEPEPRAREATEEALPDETAVLDTVRCDGICDRDVFEPVAVDVLAGTIKYRTNDDVVVEGVGGGFPVVEQWCVSCAKTEFDIHASATPDAVARTRRYVTARTATAFALGVVLAALVLLVIAV